MSKLTLARLVTLITFIALFAMAVRTPADTDMYWHLRTGQFILETRTIPAADPFSWTAFGAPWVNVHWLSQVILYSSYALLGMPGLALLVAALVVLAFVFVWRQMEGDPFARAFIVVLAAAAAGAVWTPRSQMATFVFTPLIAYLIYLYKWKQLDRLWLIPIVFVLWVSLHGGYRKDFLNLDTDSFLTVVIAPGAAASPGGAGRSCLSSRSWPCGMRPRWRIPCTGPRPST